MKISVLGGTAKDHKTDLCVTCRFATRREDSSGNKWTYCSQFKTQIPSVTISCNAYEHTNTPDVWEMRKTAWIITNYDKNKIGFVRYKDLSEDKKQELNDDISTL